MTDFIVDAPLLACPNPTLVEDSVFQNSFSDYLQRLTDISHLRINCKSAKFWRDSELVMTLHDAQCYPFRHSIRHAIESLGFGTDFQIEDICLIAASLLERSFVLEDESEWADVLFDKTTVLQDVVEGRSEAFNLNLCRQLFLASSVLGTDDKFYDNAFIASSSNDEVESIEVVVDVSMREDKDGRLIEEVLLNRGFKIKNLPAPASYISGLDLTDLWMRATDTAIADVCAIGAAKEVAANWDAVAVFRSRIFFGPNFLITMRRNGFLHESGKASRLLADCIDLIIGRNLNKSHWIRTGRGGGDPQLKRGDWGAWRHDIDHEYHLHYWRRGDKLEFSKVVVHDDFSM